jgi:methylenetetrahydrofolate dehydrogenase (NADP+)/methenyltetrahydrofolate cyclohydrolase
MTARLIDGKVAALTLREQVKTAAQAFTARTNRKPGLATVLVGEDPASGVYVRSKVKATAEAGMESIHHKLDESVTESDLLDLVRQLNPDPNVDALVPCTPLGCLKLLKAELGDLSGREAVVIGRSNIVGKPMAMLLIGESATVTVAHSRTRDLAAAVRRADIVVAAVGRPQMVKRDWIKPGATVIDVGINRVPTEDGKGRLVGDVAFEEAAEVAGAITPVPGGVGPMTIACLLRNTLVAAHRRERLEDPEGL